LEGAEPDPDAPGLTPTQRLEFLKQIQAQSDQVMRGLDQSLRSVFETLQQSIYSYQNSLNQGLNQMHTLGQQGELMFSALVNHLGQQINQETLAYLESGQRRELPQPSLETSAPETSATNTFAVEGGSLSPDLEVDLALEALELGVDLDDDITELQLDDALEAALDLDDIESPLDLPLLDSLDAAAPDPSPAVSLPERESDLSAEVAAAGLEAESALDDLYQSLFGGFLADSVGARAAEADTESTSFEGETDADDAVDVFLDVDRSIDAANTTPAIAADQAEPLTAELPRPEDLTMLIQAADSAEAEATAEFPNSNLDNLFGDATAEPLDTLAAGPLAAVEVDLPDTIESFDELLPPGPGEMGDLEAAADDGDDRIDGFMAASPDEDLLAQDDLPVTSTYDLTMDEAMIDQLRQDLDYLEAAAEPGLPGFFESTPQNEAALPSSDAAVPAESSDRDLFDLGDRAQAPDGDLPTEAAIPDLFSLDLLDDEPASSPTPQLGEPDAFGTADTADSPPDLSIDLSSEPALELEQAPVPNLEPNLELDPLDLAASGADVAPDLADLAASEPEQLSDSSLPPDLASVDLFDDAAPAVTPPTVEEPGIDLFSDEFRDDPVAAPAPEAQPENGPKPDLFDLSPMAETEIPGAGNELGTNIPPEIAPNPEAAENLAALDLFGDALAAPEATRSDASPDLFGGSDQVDNEPSFAPELQSPSLDLFDSSNLVSNEPLSAPESSTPEDLGLDLFGGSDLGTAEPPSAPEPAAPDDSVLDLFGGSDPSAAPITDEADIDRIDQPAAEAPGVDLFGDIPPRVTVSEDLLSTLDQTPPAPAPDASSLASILSDLDLSLGPEEPALGESGLTLSDLTELSADSAQPSPPASESPAAPSTGPTGPSLTLENLLGELTLDPLTPLAPDPQPGATLDDLTTDAQFGSTSGPEAGESSFTLADFDPTPADSSGPPESALRPDPPPNDAIADLFLESSPATGLPPSADPSNRPDLDNLTLASLDLGEFAPAAATDELAPGDLTLEELGLGDTPPYDAAQLASSEPVLEPTPEPPPELTLETWGMAAASPEPSPLAPPLSITLDDLNLSLDEPEPGESEVTPTEAGPDALDDLAALGERWSAGPENISPPQDTEVETPT
ncbi:hypothetical protein C8B47_29110, partial [filamentous cyanobacterium CCP4]